MKTTARILMVVVLIAAAWFVLNRPVDEETVESDTTTDVAVQVGKITQATLRAYVTAYGVIAPEPAGANPAASASIAPSLAGVVVVANFAAGQHVNKGDILFQLDSRAVDVTAAFAEKTQDRERRLFQIDGTSEKVLQNAEQQFDAARVQQALLRVQSPLSGTVTQVNVKVGEAVDLSTVMAQVVDLDRLVVSAQVPGAELGSLEIGQPAEVVLPGTESPLEGMLSFVSSYVDPQIGTVEVRIRLPDGSNVRPGQRVTARIVSEEHENILAVPVDSVVSDEDGATVISIVEGSMATRKVVTTGLREDDLIEVAAQGLQPDMTVVTLGAYGLPEVTRVRIIGN